MSFTKAPLYVKDYIEEVIKVEGGYVNNPDDSGGATKYGITESLAKLYGYLGDMEKLPLTVARDIYTEEFYFKSKLDLISDRNIQGEVFNSSVNVGSVRAVKWLQQSLNVFNNKGGLYSDLVVDGYIGNKTKIALEAYLKHRGIDGREVLYTALNCLQGAFYIDLATKREKDESFVYGWLKNRVIV